MGYYINVPGSKEAWLDEHGIRLVAPPSEDEFKQIREQNCFPICVMYNRFFTAAGIAYSLEEMNDFLRPDPRRKEWWMISKEDALVGCPELQEVL